MGLSLKQQFDDEKIPRNGKHKCNSFSKILELTSIFFKSVAGISASRLLCIKWKISGSMFGLYSSSSSMTMIECGRCIVLSETAASVYFSEARYLLENSWNVSGSEQWTIFWALHIFRSHTVTAVQIRTFSRFVLSQARARAKKKKTVF